MKLKFAIAEEKIIEADQAFQLRKKDLMRHMVLPSSPLDIRVVGICRQTQ